MALAPSPTEAHLIQSGFGPFYDGIAHVALSPNDLLLVVGISLMAGLRGPRAGRIVLVGLPAAWLLGGLAGMSSVAVIAWPLASALTLVVVGSLAAWNPNIPDSAAGGVAIVLGGLHGYLNGSLAAAGGFGLPGILGVGTTAFVLAALISALAVGARAEWARIAMRVAGSWIGAIGILMSGWALR